MNETLMFTIITLCVIGVLAAIILYFVASKFKVYEDPRIDEVVKMLPGANCGGCGYPGCKGFAEAMVANDDISNLFCNVGGGEMMSSIASYLGKEAAAVEPKVATIKCNGTCSNRPRINEYDGAKSCAIQASLYGGETACSYGCLGCGDCVEVCSFGAIKINPETGLPEVDDALCTACGACVTACPKNVIELRKRGVKGRKVYVSCSNHDKGGVARKACKAACIGCGKCAKACPFDAITIENNLAYIDASKCKLCRKCVVECPTGAIVEFGFPPRKPIEAKPIDLTATKPVAPKVVEAEKQSEQSETTTK